MTDQEHLSESVFKKFTRELGLPELDERLISRAVTHRSYLNEHTEALEDNERLEFLGDAVLDFLVGAWLYHEFPGSKEGELTRLRSALVRTEQLALFGEAIHLGQMLRLGRGEEEGGGRQRPALLCAAFEAFIGALYLHGGIDLVETFLEPFLIKTIEQILADRRDKDPKSVLQEWTQSQGKGSPNYRTVSTSGPEHDKTFQVEVVVNELVMGIGFGHSKQTAAKDAAAKALVAQGIN